jgi:hypothetical protein
MFRVMVRLRVSDIMEVIILTLPLTLTFSSPANISPISLEFWVENRSDADFGAPIFLVIVKSSPRKALARTFLR